MDRSVDPDDVSAELFLTEVPPGECMELSDEVQDRGSGAMARYLLEWPDIRIHCDEEDCGRNSIHFTDDVLTMNIGEPSREIVTYECRHCGSRSKFYAIIAWICSLESGDLQVTAAKIGEFPSFGPPTPKRLTDLLGNLGPTYHKGRRCENQGLGIGAFTYYRRIVESSKNRILDRIISVARDEGGHENLIKQLEQAKTETQFSRAIEEVKDAIPSSVKIKGHNPLTLLHRALSKGVHTMSDEECLDRATHVRVILTTFAERMDELLREDNDIKKALADLKKH